MDVEKMIPKLIRAALDNDRKSIEVISMTLAQTLKKSHPEVANEINDVITYKNLGSSSFRSIGLSELPLNRKDKSNLVRIEETTNIEMPILDRSIIQIYNQFIDEQNNIDKLLKLNVKPSNTVLLYGEPGVGKTYSAKWIASKLNRPLIILDISSVISSYLGETGSNLKKVLEYAKENNGILFLDEFDAIAKKRDDTQDIGELKRIVNVLLKELEQWPLNSIVIAATNHQEMLDKAIWRRFDIRVELGIPNKEGRIAIIQNELCKYLEISSGQLEFISSYTEGISPAELVRYCDNVKRAYALGNNNLFANLITNLFKIPGLKKRDNKDLCIDLHISCPEMSAMEISKITGVSKSSVYRYLNRGEKYDE